MRLFSGRSKLARGLIAAGATVVVAIAGALVGAGVAYAAGTDYGIMSGTPTLWADTSNSQSSFTSVDSWTTVATQNVTPRLGGGITTARFTGQSKCVGNGADGWCSIRILFNNNEMDPVTGTNFVWQWQGDGWSAHAIERTYQASGSATIKVQAAVHGGATRLVLQDWSLVTEMVV